MRRMLAIASVTALALVASLAGTATAGPRGPAFGNNRYQTEIRTAQGAPDVDDYVSPLLEGERLTVIVSAPKKSDLRPELSLIRPDGSLSEANVKTRKKGRLTLVRDLPVDATGEWTVRIAGVDGTEGLYSVRFKVKPAPPLRWAKRVLDDDVPRRTHTFPGLDGALLDVTLRRAGGRSGGIVDVLTLEDPSGADVPGSDGPVVLDFVAKNGRRALRGAPLSTGHGDYRLGIGAQTETARYSLQVQVTPTGRPKGRRAVTLATSEPFLAARTEPLRGVAGRTVVVRGGHFSVEPPPAVLFGGVPAESVSAAPDGVSLSVVPPAGEDGATVELAVVNPDGQTAQSPAYFHYSRPPRVTGLLRPDGSDVVGGDTRGGQVMRVVGDFLHRDQTVMFGDNAAGSAIGSAPGELLVITPAAPAGEVPVTVTDPFGRSSVSTFLFEYKTAPSFDAAPFDPPFAGVQSATTVILSGAGFLESDVLLIGGEETPFLLLDGSRLSVDLPALALGEHDVRVRDRVGSVVVAPVFSAKESPSIDSAQGVGGTFAGTSEVPLEGGAEIEVKGASFHALDTVRLIDAHGVASEVSVSSRTFRSFRFTSPEGAPGALDLSVTDAAGQTATLVGALRRVGFERAATARVPVPGSVDDWSAWRGAIGDLDRDGRADDVVLVSYGYEKDNVYRGARSGSSGTANTPGSRSEFTRVLIGDSAGVLVDGTASRIPGATGGEDWNAMAVAVGDLDGERGPEIVIGGVSSDYTVSNDVRILRNDGTGAFSAVAADALPHGYVGPVYAYDETGASHLVFTARYNQGLPTAIVIGDVDRDGDDDLIVGRDYYDTTYTYIDPSKVDFSQTPPYVTASNASTFVSYSFGYYAATKVFRNDLSTDDGWADVTDSALPAVGDSNAAILPALHARDLALGDIDGDADLDLVVAWDDPLTVSAYGLYGGMDQARVATRVLLNDGSGVFTDQTSTWLPAASSPEFWQAHRLVLEDLDRDGDRDLVLLLEQSVDAYLGAPKYDRPALRVLRNDGPLAGFTDVTTAALPALPTTSNDNWRGGALAVRDVDGDGWPDLVVATREALLDSTGARLRSTRLLLGGSGLVFRRGDAFLPRASADSGEADELLLGDLAGSGSPVLLRLGESSPANSADNASLRDADWRR